MIRHETAWSILLITSLKVFFLKQRTCIVREGSSKLVHTLLFAPHTTPVQPLIHQNHFSPRCKATSHVETDAGGLGEVICYILPVLCLQTWHHPLFTLNSATTWNLVPHLKLKSSAEYWESVWTQQALRWCHVFHEEGFISDQNITPAVFHASSRILRLSKHMSGTWRQHRINPPYTTQSASQTVCFQGQFLQ